MKGSSMTINNNPTPPPDAPPPISTTRPGRTQQPVRVSSSTATPVAVAGNRESLLALVDDDQRDAVADFVDRLAANGFRLTDAVGTPIEIETTADVAKHRLDGMPKRYLVVVHVPGGGRLVWVECERDGRSIIGPVALNDEGEER